MRTKGGVISKRRHSKYLKMAKGYRGARGKLYRTARESVEKALCYAYRDRKVRKREMRRLWIVRISAAAKELGTSYSRLIDAFKKSSVELDRKVLSDMAVSDPSGFAQLVKSVQPEV